MIAGGAFRALQPGEEQSEGEKETETMRLK